MGLPERIVNSPTPGVATALTTLASGMTAAQTTLAPNAAAPSTGPAAGLAGTTGQTRILIGTEVILVDTSTMNSASSWTILQRGVDGSTAATHSAGDGVYAVWTAEALANRPVAGTGAGGSPGQYLCGLTQISGNQSVTAGVTTKLNVNSSLFDPDGIGDPTTNHRINIPATVVGTIYMWVRAFVACSTGNAQLRAIILKSGTAYGSEDRVYNTLQHSTYSIVPVVAGDYLEVAIQSDLGLTTEAHGEIQCVRVR